MHYHQVQLYIYLVIFSVETLIKIAQPNSISHSEQTTGNSSIKNLKNDMGNTFVKQ